MNTMKYKNFKHLPSKDPITLTCETLPTGQRYYSVDGHKYPSVTTVTGFEKQAFFAEWRKKNPIEMTRVLDRGNKLHSLIEDYLNNKEPNPSDSSPFIWQLFMQLKSKLDQIDNIRAQEEALYSTLLGLAGRVDCVADYNGKLSIIDFKGSTKEKSEKYIENYFQQVTAYSIMWQEIYNEKIEQVVILVSSDDGASQCFAESPTKYVPSLKKCIDNYYKTIYA